MMRTRSFNFFCTPEETPGILSGFFETLKTMSILTEGANGDLMLSRTDLKELTADQPRVLWVGAGQNQPQSFLGLIRLLLPRYKNNALCMASIAIKTDGDEEQIKTNLRVYERLKKNLRQRLKSGVWGINKKTGGEHFYRDLYISDAAITHFRSGLELAPESGDGFVRFEYRGHNAARAGVTAS